MTKIDNLFTINTFGLSANQEFEQLPKMFGKCLFGNTNRCRDKSGIKKAPKAHYNPAIADTISKYAKENLNKSGKLCLDDSGFIFVDVQNEYIYDLHNLLNDKKLAYPPYFSNSWSGGAHISVVLPGECNTLCHKALGVSREISFEITGCYSVEPENLSNIDMAWFLTINSPVLERIRVALGLTPKIDDREFHITFSVKNRFLDLTDILMK